MVSVLQVAEGWISLSIQDNVVMSTIFSSNDILNLYWVNCGIQKHPDLHRARYAYTLSQAGEGEVKRQAK